MEAEISRVGLDIKYSIEYEPQGACWPYFGGDGKR